MSYFKERQRVVTDLVLTDNWFGFYEITLEGSAIEIIPLYEDQMCETFIGKHFMIEANNLLMMLLDDIDFGFMEANERSLTEIKSYVCNKLREQCYTNNVSFSFVDLVVELMEDKPSFEELKKIKQLEVSFVFNKIL